MPKDTADKIITLKPFIDPNDGLCNFSTAMFKDIAKIATDTSLDTTDFLTIKNMFNRPEQSGNQYLGAIISANDIIIGYTTILSVIDEAEIINIAIAKTARRCGMGMALLQFQISYLAQHKFRKLFLEVRQSNIAAINLYKRLGFMQISKRKNYYKLADNGREDALVLCLIL